MTSLYLPLRFSSALFLLGVLGRMVHRHSMLMVLRSMELRLLAVNLNFLLFSTALDDLVGRMFSLLMLTVAAAESAVGLAMLVVFYRVRGSMARETAQLRQG
jgi:NADH-quinone oxidoreductase subunit K